jgi:hypothetical protein
VKLTSLTKARTQDESHVHWKPARGRSAPPCDEEICKKVEDLVLTIDPATLS